MKGEQFKHEWDGCPRTMFQPVRTDEQFPKNAPYVGYLRNVKGHSHPWMCYCINRHDWLVRTMVNNGVRMDHFLPPSRKVPKSKCREIARMLERIRREKSDVVEDMYLLEHDIRFWGHCGGVRIHDWKHHCEIS